MSTRRKRPARRPKQRRQVVFLVGPESMGEDENVIFTKEAADSIIGKYTMFQGIYETQVLNAEVTHDGKYISVTVAVPEKILKEMGL